MLMFFLPIVIGCMLLWSFNTLHADVLSRQPTRHAEVHDEHMGRAWTCHR